ncbi:hypothetical protein BGW38_006396 [Lunasporangiospora selenospora]|uniref:Metallo-beta-lactamase domain-containing protein n=1 Tax=Lunasporangiospora selenospora TaxID=979761 RepID=A0A9P6KAB3_9FUNG|nr:hypothetical protein BGW38_006396 [Lunasporangiospora selenospora]
MRNLVELDALRLTVVVDNEVDTMSSVPKELGFASQAQRLFKDLRNIDQEKSNVDENGAHCPHPGHRDDEQHVRSVAYDFMDLCCGAHGLSILVTGIKGNVEHRVLFDTGPQSAIFLENAKRLELEFEKIEVIVLSHWHIDHSGGMLAAVDKCREARQHQQKTGQVIVDLHPDRPDQRGSCLTRLPPPGQEPPQETPLIEYVAWGADPSFEGLETKGAKITKHGEAHTICEGFFGISGLIPRLTSYETGIPNHVRWSNTTRSWSSEPEIMDERYLVAKVKSKGIVVLTGCSHAGVINVCKDVQNAFAKEDELFFVVGGFHLAGATVETRIAETVKDMISINPSFMAPGHCSGWRSKLALENAMPGRVVSLGVGSDFVITEQ